MTAALAEAFVLVKPDLAEFKTDMDRVGKDYSVKVKATPDTVGFKEKLDEDVKRDGTTAKVKVEAESGSGGFFGRAKGGLAKEGESVGKETGKHMGHGLSSGISNAMSGGGVQTAALAVGGGLAYVLKQGANLTAANSQLSQSMKNVGLSFKNNAGAIDANNSKMASYGYSATDAEGSLNSLILVTHNLSSATGLESDAANLAAAKHISLSAATQQVTQAFNGSGRAIKLMGDATVTGATQAKALTAGSALLADRIKTAGGMAKFAAANHMTLAQAQNTVDAANKGSIPAFNALGLDIMPTSASSAMKAAEAHRLLAKYQGDAAAQAKAAPWKVLSAQFGNMAEQIGTKLLPPLLGVMRFFTNPAVMKATLLFIGIAGGIFLMTKAVNFAKDAWEAIQAVLAVDPFVLVAIAIAILAVLIIKYHKQIWAVIVKVWGDIAKFISEVWNDLLKFLKKFGPVFLKMIEWVFFPVEMIIIKYHKAIFAFIVKTWDAIIKFLKTAWDKIVGVVSHGIKDVVGYFKAWPGEISKVLLQMYHDIVNVWDKVTRTLGKVASIFGDTFKNIWHFFDNWIVQPIETFFGELPGLLHKAVAEVVGAAKAIGGAIAHAGGSVLSGLNPFAAGTNNAPAGWGITGERGPELIKFVGGETVIPNAKSRAMLNAGALPGYAAGTPSGAAASMLSAPGQDQTAMLAKLDQICALLKQLAPATGIAVGRALDGVARNAATQQTHRRAML